MIDAWIRVRAHLSKTRVAKKLAPLCKRVHSETQLASGVLQDFWSGASQFSKDGFIRDEDDQTLEDWANWKGKPGIFAAWVREKHMDADGRINDWDEYMGVLETKRAKDRERKRIEREKKKTALSNGTSRGQSEGRHADSPVDAPRDVRTHDTERNVTQRDVTKRTELQNPFRGRAKKPRAATDQPPWVPALVDVWVDKVGAVTHGRLGNALRAIVAKYGVEAVVAAIGVYASDDEGPKGIRRIEYFADEFVKYHRIAQEPLVDPATGLPTARTNKLLRPE